jgi:beta-1,4-mannosyltransferase
MRVVNGPDVGSPYQRLLHNHLVELGVSHRQFQARSVLPLTRATWSGATVLHLDWLHPFYASPDASKARLKQIHLQTDVLLMRKVPIVWNVHNLVSHGGTEREDDEAGRILLDRIDTFVSFTQAGVEQIYDRWPWAKSRQVVVIPHGNFIGAYPDAISPLEARRRLDLPDDARVALFLGRIQQYKGVDELIAAYRSVAGKNDWLVVVGEPENSEIMSALRQLASTHPRIRLSFQRIPDSEIQTFLNAADFCVYPFNRIFNSGAVILALSFRKAVVAPATSVLQEVAGPEALIPISGQENGLRDALRAAFECGDIHSRGHFGYQRVAKRNSWRDVALQFKNLYQVRSSHYQNETALHDRIWP